MNWTLAGILGLLGFSGCNKFGVDEYGTPHADYTVKGAVFNKATGKPLAGIRVAYNCESCITLMYGVLPTHYASKAHVMTNAKGEFKLTDRFDAGEPQMIGNKGILPVYAEDRNGVFQNEILPVDFSNAEHSGNAKGWYKGEYTVNVNVELTEIESKSFLT